MSAFAILLNPKFWLLIRWCRRVDLQQINSPDRPHGRSICTRDDQKKFPIRRLRMRIIRRLELLKSTVCIV
jgi:hypothetical protein